MTEVVQRPEERAGAFQQQLEVEERRRSLVLILLSLAAVVALWLGVFQVAFGGGASAAAGWGAGNVVFVGFNGSQSFWLWAPPGSAVWWDVAFCNLADVNVTAAVRVVEVPPEIRRFLFHVNGARFGWDGVNNTGLRVFLGPKSCVSGKLEIVVDSRSAKNTVYLIKGEVLTFLSSQ